MPTARYDAVADFYEARFSDPADPVLVALLDLLGPAEGHRVLDLACGHGRAARELARHGAIVTAVDISQALLEKAQAHGPAAIRYVHADVAAAPQLPDASFDAVVCSFGLSDIDDLDGALATVRRTLTTGGTFVFSILHPCFAGAGDVSGAWPANGSYHDEVFWRADGEYSTLRRQVGAQHRTLATYVNALSRHGLILTAMAEPAAPPQWSTDDRRDAARLPVFLVARCRRDESSTMDSP
jgi:SAM-dependent methyltransferase